MNKLKIFFAFLFCLSLVGCASPYKAHLKRADLCKIEAERFLKEAIKEYEAALENAEEPSEIYFTLGSLFYQHGQYDKAIENLSLLNTLAAEKLLAFTYYKSGDYTDALSLFDRRSDTWVWRVMPGITLNDRFDHVLFRGDLRCTGARVSRVRASDHMPVLAVFVAAGEQASPGR